MLFQLTPSRRATYSRMVLKFKLTFQLTPSRRATMAMKDGMLRIIFQLTPSRRATSTWRPSCSREEYFNSRPHGGRHDRRQGLLFGGDFNSRPHGGRHYYPADQYEDYLFQLTPSRRATRTGASGTGQPRYFNSRPHGGRQHSRPQCSPLHHFNSRPHGGRL